MVKVIEMKDMDEQVKTFFNKINTFEEQYLVLDAGKPVFCIVRPEKMDRIQRFAVYERIWNKNQGVYEYELEKTISEAVEEVRSQKENKNLFLSVS